MKEAMRKGRLRRNNRNHEVTVLGAIKNSTDRKEERKEPPPEPPSTDGADMIVTNHQWRSSPSHQLGIQHAW